MLRGQTMVTRKVPGTSRTALCFCTLQGSRRDGSSYARVAPRRCLRAGAHAAQATYSPSLAGEHRLRASDKRAWRSSPAPISTPGMGRKRPRGASGALPRLPGSGGANAEPTRKLPVPGGATAPSQLAVWGSPRQRSSTEAARTDVPVITPSVRGSLDDLQLVLASDRDSLIDQVNAARHVASAQAPRDSLLGTWCKILREWHGEDIQVVPVQPEDIIVVGAVMKKKGYRSFPNYVSRVKELHIRAGFDWSQRHALETTQISRSVIRGPGRRGNRQSYHLARLW